MSARAKAAALSCCLLVTVALGSARATPGQGSRHQIDELRADLSQLRRSLEQHPALYAVTDETAFNRLFKQANARIDHPLTLAEFYGLVAPIVASVGCGHTAVLPPAGYWTASAARFLPIRFAIVGSRAYVGRIAGDAGSVPPGAEVTAIDGVAIPELLARIKAAISADIEAGKNARLNSVTLHDLYALLVGTPEKFEVEFVGSGGSLRQRVVLQAIDRNALSDLMSDPKRPTSIGDPRLDFIIDKPTSTAVLTIRSFACYQDEARVTFGRFIDRAFDDIRSAGIKHLVVDLRGNPGGDPFCTKPLLARLAAAPVSYFARAYPGYVGFDRPIPLAANRFAGRLSILIDGNCFSSTGHLCALLKFHHIGEFIGSETGATYECNDNSQEITLQHTALRLRVARTTFAVAVRNMPRRTGIVPDHAVSNTIEDILNGRDRVMEYARTR